MSVFHQNSASHSNSLDITKSPTSLLKTNLKITHNEETKENCLSVVKNDPDFFKESALLISQKIKSDFCNASNSSESFLCKDLFLEETQASTFKFERSSTISSTQSNAFELFCKRFFLYNSEKSKEIVRHLSPNLAANRKSGIFSLQKVKPEDQLLKCENVLIEKQFKEKKTKKSLISLSNSADLLVDLQKNRFEDIQENSKDVPTETNELSVSKAKKFKRNSQCLPSRINTSPKSEQILLEKLKLDFFSCLEKSQQKMSYSCFVKVLRKLSMISGKNTEETHLMVQLWNTITSDAKAETSKVLQYLTAVMRYNTVNIKNQLSKQETEKIHKKYFLFYSNRLASNKSKKKKKEELTFRPCINENSKFLVSNLSDGSRLKKLIEKSCPSVKLQKIKEEQDRVIENECTFKPVINSASRKFSCAGKESLVEDYQNITKKNIERTKALYSLANVINERRKARENTQRDKDEEELSKFTFSPKINSEGKKKTSIILEFSPKAEVV